MKTMIHEVLHDGKQLKTPQEVIRKMRELRGLRINKAADLFGHSRCWLQHLEKGRSRITQDKLLQILEVYSFKEEDYESLLCGKELNISPVEFRPLKVKTVFKNEHRRSYKKIILKEVRVLKILRKSLKISQDKASKLCGYCRPTIGHIEQGRIEIPLSRIRHIVSCYGYSMEDFNALLNSEVLRDEVLEECHNLIVNLPEDKLRVVQNLLKNF